MQADLGAFLRRMAAEPFVYGEFDCALIVADWWALNHGTDPAAHLRGAYSDREGCHALLKREGGVLRVVTRLARSVGAVRAQGEPGDFGVIRHDGRHHGAIRTKSGRWAVKGEACVTVLSFPKVVAAWRV